MRAPATRRARYGTVIKPTITASTSAADASTKVAQRFPDSLDTVEKSAAPKARVKPTIAIRKRTHTSGISRCRKRENRWIAEDSGVLAGFMKERIAGPRQAAQCSPISFANVPTRRESEFHEGDKALALKGVFEIRSS